MKKYFLIGFIFLSLFLALFSLYKINLPTADIGRHIVNGDVFLHNGEYDISAKDILYKNSFSFTYPEFPFINHHFGSGIAIYLIFILFGFSGLSFIYFLLILGALIFVIQAIKNNTDISSLLLVSIFLMPMIASRTEVRPEGLSYFFVGLFIFILYRYTRDDKDNSSNQISQKLIWLLPLTLLFWVNSHIYFIFGPFLIGAFLTETLILRNLAKIKKLSLVLATSIVAMCINPYGVWGVLYPFTIFRNYGYRIVENQSINFLENISFTNPDFLWYKITFILVFVSSLVILIKKRASFPSALFIIAFTFGILGYLGIRHIPLFALVSLPLLSFNITTIKQIFNKQIEKIDLENKIIILVISICIILSATVFQFKEKLPWNRDFGLGIQPDVMAPIEFIKKSGVRGPFFNNYDIGGFMIFGLFKQEKVFVDNRPEAYPKEFFQNVYIPMQENDRKWEEEMIKNKFNAIFFYRLDYTPWAQKFLISRINDQSWAPVFVDDQTIIFLYRNKGNKEIIKKYELPKEMFSLN